MRRSIVISILAGALCTVLAVGASAQAATESDLDNDSNTINRGASSDSGAAAVIQAIKTMFPGVTADDIAGWRADNLGYGEIVILLSLANNMEGGLTDENINSILTTHQGPPVVGWGKIARDLGLNLGTLVSGVVKVAERSQAILKAQSASGNGNGAGSSGGASSGAGVASGAGAGAASAGGIAGAGHRR